MDYSRAWLHFREAEDEYYASRGALMQDETLLVSDLSLALSRASDNCTALRFLAEVCPKVEVVLPLVPSIVGLAVDSSSHYRVELAQDVLHSYESEPQIKSIIQEAVSAYLAENDEWHYRRIAELYELMDYKEELTNFLSLCRVNANLEIQEVNADFAERGSKGLPPVH